MVLIHAEALEGLQAELAEVKALVLAQAAMAPPARSKQAYKEPGPHSERQFFTAKELQARWEISESTFYTISQAELPVWKTSGRSRYFWAYVWAYEGRITRQAAGAIFEGQLARIHALQAS